jgi:hypothetical protein
VPDEGERRVHRYVVVELFGVVQEVLRCRQGGQRIRQRRIALPYIVRRDACEARIEPQVLLRQRITGRHQLAQGDGPICRVRPAGDRAPKEERQQSDDRAPENAG